MGLVVRSWMLVAGGLTLLGLIAFQILVGTRTIRFKGPRHWKIHRYSAYALAVFAVFHALAALIYLGAP